MASLLNKLGSNEAVLLMYLADELPPEDHADVQQMLASDEALRDQLQSLRQLRTQVGEQFGPAEKSGMPCANEAAIQRTLTRMRRYRLEAAARPAVEVRAGRRWPTWAYPLAAAAAIVFITIGLWGVGIINFGPDLPGIVTPLLPPDLDGGLDEQELAEGPLGPVGPALDAAARHAQELQLDDDDDGLLLML
jgi:hypothetical protein